MSGWLATIGSWTASAGRARATVIVWVLLSLLLAGFYSQLPSQTNDNLISFLPPAAESYQASERYITSFERGAAYGGFIVYHRPGGLTPADRVRLAADIETLIGSNIVTFDEIAFAPGARPDLVTLDGSTAIVSFKLGLGEISDASGSKIATLRKIVHQGQPTGLGVYVTGSAGLNADLYRALDGADLRLLGLTAGLILILLLLIYRSPGIALLPIITAAAAYVISGAIIYLLAQQQLLEPNSQALALLVVLMFGAGTDYCLLVIARWREEMSQSEDRFQAASRAAAKTAPAIFSAAAAISAAVFCLRFSEIASTRAIGPIAAIGVMTVALASLTLLPALLALSGRLALWPRARASLPEPRRWRWIGQRVTTHGARSSILIIALLALASLGLGHYRSEANFLGALKGSSEALEGYRVMGSTFPVGEIAPLRIIVERLNGPLRRRDRAAALQLLKTSKDVGQLRLGPLSRDRRALALTVVLRPHPFSNDGLRAVARLRSRLRQGLTSETRAQVGGDPAIQLDLEQASEQDLYRIAPLVLVCTLLILILLLRALLAPLLLLATVILGFGASIGLTSLLAPVLLGEDHFAFGFLPVTLILLLALGIDYNIFLMHRVRQQAAGIGTREAVVEALSSTGSVISSAGLILAASFIMLLALPLVVLEQIGLAVALGVVIDTFIIRTVLVPALIGWCNERSWWPGRRSSGDDE